MYQPLTLDDVDPSHLIMVTWVDEEGLVTTATAPTWVYYLVNSVIHRRNEVRWF